MALPFIHIPKPCSENWDKMTPTACGRFCNVCQKEVIDLSVMDDATVTQTLTEKGGALCVRARADQVVPNTPPVLVRTIRLTKLALFALALVCVFSCESKKSDATLGAPLLNDSTTSLTDSSRIDYKMGEIPSPTTKNKVIINVVSADKVVSGDYKKVNEAKIEIFKEGKCIDSVLTDSTGSCIFIDFPTGEYLFKASYNGLSREAKVKISFRYSHEIDFILGHPARLTGMFYNPVKVRDSLPLTE